MKYQTQDGSDPRSTKHIHIQQIGRVFKKDPTAWLSITRELEEGADVMRSLYAPLRTAILAEIRENGSGLARLNKSLNKLADTKANATVKMRSRAALGLFIEHVLPTLESVEEDYITGRVPQEPIRFEGALLTGGFHAMVKTKLGEPNLIYVFASDWDPSRREAVLELLTVVAERRHGLSRDKVLLIDLAEGQVYRPASTYKKTRGELARTVHLLLRFWAA